jgi:hypothetical protein
MQGRTRLGLTSIVAVLIAIGVWAGCTFNLDLGADTLFPTGTSFVMRGTAENVPSSGGACNIWRGQNGVVYHLFQGVRVDNADFDRMTTPGVTSRIEVATRTDLVVDCLQGTIVEVRQVLEIVE